jgi:hypothetical protein
MIEHALHHGLAVIEGAFNRERMNIGRGHARHLPTLHVRDAAMRIEDEDVDLIEALECLDRSASRIA